MQHPADGGHVLPDGCAGDVQVAGVRDVQCGSSDEGFPIIVSVHLVHLHDGVQCLPVIVVVDEFAQEQPHVTAVRCGEHPVPDTVPPEQVVVQSSAFELAVVRGPVAGWDVSAHMVVHVPELPDPVQDPPVGGFVGCIPVIDHNGTVVSVGHVFG